MLAKNVDPDQMPRYVASDLGPHCLPMILLQVSQKEWAKPGLNDQLYIIRLQCHQTKCLEG